MKKIMEVKLSNGKTIKVEIEKAELIYGATAIISSDIETDVVGYNPVTKEELPIIKINGEVNRFFIPSHIQTDYEYAIKHNMALKQVVAPYFNGTCLEKPKQDIETHERNSVIVVIKKDDNYLCLSTRGRSCNSFVMGGIENNETIKEAAIRETLEETGYDVTIDYVYDFKVVNHFYARYKGINRYAYLNFAFGKLNNNNHSEIKESEMAKHEVMWIKEDKLNTFIDNDFNKFALDIILNGEKAYEEDGVMMTNDKNNKKKSKIVREYIENNYCL